MVAKQSIILNIVLIILTALCQGCSKIQTDKATLSDRYPEIFPDYRDITIPPNIAPMNFAVREDGGSFLVKVITENGDQMTVKNGSGIIRFNEKRWKRIIASSAGKKIEFRVYMQGRDRKEITGFKPFIMQVAREPVDPYLAYRLIHPGYYSWSKITIKQRSLESFDERSVVENQVIEKNCVNCHSFNNNRSDRFMIHMRGSKGGTYFISGGEISRRDPKTEEMPGNPTYPSWHPGGRFVAFSSNQVRQSFYSIPSKTIEVFDLASSVVIYDTEKNETVTVTDSDTTNYLKTFPSWSPDGEYLYYCRAQNNISASDPTLDQIMNTHYDLVRQPFDPESMSFGSSEVVISASEQKASISFPRISPDGRFLVYTRHDYGTFPIWHREADLWMLDLADSTDRKMSVNSSETESYHCWSTNGRWLVFSSKRIDGRSARPFIAYIDQSGNQQKEFVLPQENPVIYDTMLESFNIPEFVNGRIKTGPRDIVAASGREAIKAVAGNWQGRKGVEENKEKFVLKKNEKAIH